nr:MAG TPA: hypothetical protein [Caudoviricetes sp.]
MLYRAALQIGDCFVPRNDAWVSAPLCGEAGERVAREAWRGESIMRHVITSANPPFKVLILLPLKLFHRQNIHLYRFL